MDPDGTWGVLMAAKGDQIRGGNILGDSSSKKEGPVRKKGGEESKGKQAASGGPSKKNPKESENDRDSFAQTHTKTKGISLLKRS